ncbi:MAG: lipopolysaccharide assembly protein LapA domain-containing protein [bacterium]|nr:lipopolysaccharide assembly protein LapA domain-containing protein [bacterium]
MSRIGTILLLAVVIAFSYFAFYNQGVVTVNLWHGKAMELPVVGVVLISMGFGSLIILLLFAIRGVRKTYGQIQVGIQRRKRTKAEELYNRGVDAHLSGKMQEAVKLLEEAVGKDSEYLMPFFRLGMVYLELGEVKKALLLHERALEAHPNNLRVLLLLVDDYMTTGQLSEAADVLRKIIRRDESNRTALTALRDIQEHQAQWEGAVESQRKLMKAAGKDSGSQERLLGLRYQWAAELLEKGETDKAVKALREILKEAPEFVAATVTLGDARIRAGRVDDGINVLVEGYRRHQNPVFLQVMEEKLLGQENPRKLIETFRSLLDQSPSDIFLNLFYGKICLRLEMVDEGYMALKKVESTGYESPLLHALLGEISARRERYTEAMEEYGRYVELSDGSNPRFTCGNCGHTVDRWASRCKSCGLWNSFTLPGLTEIIRTPAASPQYESEQ